MADAHSKFTFEADANQVASIRSEMAAVEARKVLLDRLRMDSTKIGPDTERLLLKYCIEVPLNIAWYERARRSAQTIMRAQRLCVVVIMLGGLGAVAWITTSQIDKQLVTAQIGTMLATLLFALQVLVTATDKKAQLGGFWRASADLKEGWYTFEQSWSGRVPLERAALAEFETAVWQEIHNARKIARTEREAYFNTFKSAGELLTLASAGLDTVRSRGQQLAAQLKEDNAISGDARAAARKQLSDVRQKLMESKASIAASEAKEAALRDTAAAAEEIQAASKATISARAELVRYTEMMRMMAEVDPEGHVVVPG